MPVSTIGRDPTSVVRFDLADDLEVSTRHAEITEDDEGVYSITDKESTNGTWVNGARVREFTNGGVPAQPQRAQQLLFERS